MLRRTLAAVLLLPACQCLAAGSVTEVYGGRQLIVHAPARLPPPGTRALVVVLHGGLGNARRIESAQSESGLNLDAVADRGGFVVAYLNGTQAARMFDEDMLAWNAGGGCCGQPAKNEVDDVAYLKGAIDHLAGEYAIDRRRVFGLGHSNGAMMSQRMMCETGLYAAVAAISGPLNLDPANCAAARGKRILAIHGADDRNVPIAGGRGTRGISDAVYQSEAHGRDAYLRSGAAYELQIVQGADHKLDHLEAAIEKAEGQTLAEKVCRFFGLIAR